MSAPDTPDLDIIIVSYNTAEMTVRAIESVIQETLKSTYNIIVIDNASADNSVALIENHFPDITLIQTGENLGFAKAVNQGVQSSSADYILLLNPDTVILDNAIDKLMYYHRDKTSKGFKLSAVGGITLNNDHSLNPNNARAFISTFTLFMMTFGFSKVFNKSCFFNRDNYGCWNRKTEKQVDVITGCFFLTTRSLWHQLNGLDERFFMYAEEADYCKRAKSSGYQAWVTPDAKIIHHGGASETEFAGKMVRLLKAKTEFIDKHQQGLVRILQQKLLLLHIINKMLLAKVSSLIKPVKKTQFIEWQRIYQARNEWQKGF